MDIALALERLLPAAQYAGSVTANDQATFDAIQWLDVRPKPLWTDLVAADIVAQDAISAKVQRKVDFKADANYITMLAALKSATPAQVQTYITTNVTDLPSARAMLVKLALIVAILANGGS